MCATVERQQHNVEHKGGGWKVNSKVVITVVVIQVVVVEEEEAFNVKDIKGQLYPL